MARPRSNELNFPSDKVAAAHYSKAWELPVRAEHVREYRGTNPPGIGSGGRIYDEEFGAGFREFFEAKIKSRQQQIEKAGGPASKEEWQILILGEKFRREKRANDIADKKLMPIAERDAEIRDMANAVQGVLNQLPGRFATELAGRTPADIESRSRIMIDEAIAKLSRGESQ